MLIWCSRIFVGNVEKQCAAQCLCENRDTFHNDSLNRSSKVQQLFEIEIFCNLIMSLQSLLINYYVSLLNKDYFLEKKL